MSVSKTAGGCVTCQKTINCDDYRDAIENTRYSLNDDGTLGEPVGNSNSIGSAVGSATSDIDTAAVETLADYINNSLYGNSGGAHNLGTNFGPLQPGECIKPRVSNCPTITMTFQTCPNDPDSDGLTGFEMSGDPLLSFGFEIVTDCA
jgi:hypothetical protein